VQLRVIFATDISLVPYRNALIYGRDALSTREYVFLVYHYLKQFVGGKFPH